MLISPNKVKKEDSRLGPLYRTSGLKFFGGLHKKMPLQAENMNLAEVLIFKFGLTFYVAW